MRSGALSRVLAAGLLLAFSLAGRSARAQDPPGWQHEDVAEGHLVTGCVNGMTVAGFEYDFQGRPVVAWREENGCGPTPRVFWTRKESGTWVTHEFLTERHLGGGAHADFFHQLVLRPSDGNPFLIYRDAGSFNDLNTYRTDLGLFPTGGGSVYLEPLAGPQNCASVNYALAFSPDAPVPDWSSGMMNCSEGGAVRLNGVQVGSGYRPRPALAVAPDGTRHLLWNIGEEVYYTRWPAGDAAPGPSVRLFANLNRFGGEVSLVAGADGVLHALVRGLFPDADWDSGALVYIKSTDGGLTWSPIEYIDPGDAVPGRITYNNTVSLSVDAAGVPSVTYWFYSYELYFARRQPDGTWSRTLLSSPPNGGAPRSSRVASDLAGNPVVAYYDVATNHLRLAREVAANHPPAAAPDAAATLVDTAIDIAVLANDTDADGDALSVASVSQGSQGSAVSINPDATLHYLPAPGFAGTDAFDYTVSDGYSSSATATVTVTVSAPNRPPVLVSPGDQTSEEGASVSLTLLASDVDGDALTFAVAGLPPGLSLDSATGRVTGTIAPGAAAASPYAVVAAVNDGRGAPVSLAFAWRVVVVPPPPPQCLPPSAGLAAWWTGNGTTTDAAGGRPGVVHGGVTYAPGVNGSALMFDGTSGYVEVPAADDDDLYPGNGPFTLSAWVQTTSMETLIVASKLEADCAECTPRPVSSILLLLFQGYPMAMIRNPDTVDGYFEVTGMHSIADGAFHHIAIVRENFPAALEGVPDFGVLRLYIDGEPEQLEIVTITGSIGDENGQPDPFVIGAWQGGEDHYAFFSGAVDDLAFHRRALSPAEIRGTFVQRTAGYCHGSENRAPVLAPIPDQVSTEGATVVLPLAAHDPDGDLLSFSSPNGPLSFDPATGIFSGLVPVPGTYPVTVAVSDGSLSDSRSFTWTVLPSDPTPPVIVRPADQRSREGQHVSLLVQAHGAAASSLRFAAHDLPPGLAIDAATGLISGTLGAQSAGRYQVTVSVSDTANTSTAGFEWRVLNTLPRLQILTPGALPTGQVGLAYVQALRRTGGRAPFTWALVGGALPPGIHLGPSGSLDGTPTLAGAYTFWLRLSDAVGDVVTQAFTLDVQPALAIVTAILPEPQQGVPYAAALVAAGGTLPYRWSRTSGVLPAGLTLHPATGLLGGTPTTLGTYVFTLRVTDALGALSVRAYTLLVGRPWGALVVEQAWGDGGAPSDLGAFHLVARRSDGLVLPLPATNPAAMALPSGSWSLEIASRLPQTSSLVLCAKGPDLTVSPGDQSRCLIDHFHNGDGSTTGRGMLIKLARGKEDGLLQTSITLRAGDTDRTLAMGTTPSSLPSQVYIGVPDAVAFEVIAAPQPGRVAAYEGECAYHPADLSNGGALPRHKPDSGLKTCTVRYWSVATTVPANAGILVLERGWGNGGDTSQLGAFSLVARSAGRPPVVLPGASPVVVALRPGSWSLEIASTLPNTGSVVQCADKTGVFRIRAGEALRCRVDHFRLTGGTAGTPRVLHMKVMRAPEDAPFETSIATYPGPAGLSFDMATAPSSSSLPSEVFVGLRERDVYWMTAAPRTDYTVTYEGDCALSARDEADGSAGPRVPADLGLRECTVRYWAASGSATDGLVTVHRAWGNGGTPDELAAFDVVVRNRTTSAAFALPAGNPAVKPLAPGAWGLDVASSRPGTSSVVECAGPGGVVDTNTNISEQLFLMATGVVVPCEVRHFHLTDGVPDTGRVLHLKLVRAPEDGPLETSIALGPQPGAWIISMASASAGTSLRPDAYVGLRLHEAYEVIAAPRAGHVVTYDGECARAPRESGIAFWDQDRGLKECTVTYWSTMTTTPE